MTNTTTDAQLTEQFTAESAEYGYGVVWALGAAHSMRDALAAARSLPRRVGNSTAVTRRVPMSGGLYRTCAVYCL